MKEPKDPPRPATMIPAKYCPRCSPDTYNIGQGVNRRYKIRCSECGGVWDWKHLTGYVFIENKPVAAPPEEATESLEPFDKIEMDKVQRDIDSVNAGKIIDRQRLLSGESIKDDMRQLLSDVQAILSGYSQDDTWSEWDESVRKRVLAVQYQLEPADPLPDRDKAGGDASEVLEVLEDMLAAFKHIGGIGREEKYAAQTKTKELIRKIKAAPQPSQSDAVAFINWLRKNDYIPDYPDTGLWLKYGTPSQQFAIKDLYTLFTHNHKQGK